ncbi:3-dehydroquinate dehydratase [Chishuiella changwenlii]|jgi:3-dehydroquinate dehydratase-2|uniref:3-dehydroquinate dehydratase n=1 Tax=Chishuiella changwenlii TaxID=1434701 RepID=A0A1M6U8J0_9FLAO|nr:type II 3-dehydroquinate dehydratase [Chishuiella changwenlii]GGE99565.1 3-dehydroquinate dehydratase [Chishuiella changwenlii]SHK65470.1 3-dehydroquinate dehydratase [Chishuiella changwenlii]
MKQIQIINGPNLNLLGVREPEIYGTQTFEDFFRTMQRQFPTVSLHYYQSNHEGDIIDKLHEVGFKYDGIILNGGAYTHYSYAIADAIKAIKTKVVEVHISDIYAREDFRKNSVTGEGCLKIISGKGLPGYIEAVELFMK